MTTPYEIPLSPEAQTFQIQLGGTNYFLNLYWNSPGACWGLDIADALGTPLVSGIAVITGVDLLAQYAYLGFPGQLIAQTDNNPDAVPTFNNLGNEGHIYFVAP